MFTHKIVTVLFLFLRGVRASCEGDACHICNCSYPVGDVQCRPGTALTEIPCNVPPGTNGLYAVGNLIKDLGDGDLANATSLQYLFVSSNRLTSINAKDLTGLSHLGELYLQNNSISSVDEMAFSDTASLGYIELSDNQLHSIPNVRGLQSLTTLSLFNNLITEVRAADFENVPQLCDVKLSGNNVSTVEKGSLDSLPAMRGYQGRICLDGNPLNCCGLEWLRGMEALDSLCDKPTVCASPKHVAGTELKNTRGVICT